MELYKKEKLNDEKNINNVNNINNNNTNDNSTVKQKSNTFQSTKSNATKSKKSKTKNINNKSSNNESSIKKEIIEQKINIEDKLIITLGQELPFNIHFIPDTLGKFKASIVFQLEDGISFDIDILANIIGPELAINTPLIDFGLFPSGTIQKREIK